MNTPDSADALSVTLAPLAGDGSGDAIKAAMDKIAALRLRHVQISATMPGLRPRDLDRTARRDVLASLRRRELAPSGLDAWIPADHFDDATTADRAVRAVTDIIALAADLDRVPVSLILPADPAIVRTLVEAAQRAGVPLADHASPFVAREGVDAGIDPAAHLAANADPVSAVHACGDRLIVARLVDLLRTGMRGPIGFGHEHRLDIAGYKIALSVNGYRRPVVIDARQWSEPWRSVERSIRAWSEI